MKTIKHFASRISESTENYQNLGSLLTKKRNLLFYSQRFCAARREQVRAVSTIRTTITAHVFNQANNIKVRLRAKA